MVNFIRVLKGRELQFKALAITALASYSLQLTGSLLHWQLWFIALATIIPWIPLFSMKMIWSSRHYGYIALFLVFVTAQAGHFMEHLIQIIQFTIYGQPTYPKCMGWSWNGPSCPDARGLFSDLDRESVHFGWESFIVVAGVILWVKFPRNPWMPWMFLAAFIHEIEHIFLFSVRYLFDVGYPAQGQVFGLTVKKLESGILAKDGVLGSLTGLNGFVNSILPNRLNLHFFYNAIVLGVMVLAFSYQLRHFYDRYLAKALPKLNLQELIRFTETAKYSTYKAGEFILKPDDVPNQFYIITQGQVEIIEQPNSDEPANGKVLACLDPGESFGEPGKDSQTGCVTRARAKSKVETLNLKEKEIRLLVDSFPQNQPAPKKEKVSSA